MDELNLQRKRLYVVLVLLLVFAFLATTSLSYWVARETIRDNIVDAELPLTGDSIYSEIQRDIIKPVFVSDQMAHNTFLLDWLASPQSDPDALIRYLREIQSRYGAITSFFISERTRNYYNTNGLQRPLSQTDPRDVWYFRVRAMKDAYEINFDLDATNRNRLTAFINFRMLNDKGEFVGVTGVGLSSTAISELIGQYETKFKRRIAFYDQAGKQVMAAENNPDSGTNLREQAGIRGIADQVLNSSAVQTRLAYANTSDSSLTHVNSRYVKELKWYLVVSQDERAALAPLRRMFVWSLAVGTGATLAALALVLWTVARYQRHLTKLATMDSLTGLFNRSSGDLLMKSQLKEARDKQQAASLLVIDIDHFKRVNDTYGHLAGDGVIQAVARQIQQAVRASDTTSRWGGEEFVVLMPNTPLAVALERAELIRSAVASHAISLGELSLNQSLSIGVAEWAVGEGEQSLFARADQAMIQAKQSGRNRVVGAEAAKPG